MQRWAPLRSLRRLGALPRRARLPERGRALVTFEGRAGGRRAAWGAAALGLGVAALGWQRHDLTCEVLPATSTAVETDVRVVTYNVLSPPLATPEHFSKNAPEHVDHKNRFPKIVEQLEREVAAGSIIGLQEVDLGWAGQLHAFFAERGYTAVLAQYGKPFNGYMGVMLAWPTATYEVQDVEIARLSDTAPKGLWPKGEKRAQPDLNAHGFLTRSGLKEILGCAPPAESRPDSPPFDSWHMAKDRMNEVIFVRLRPRQSKQSFVVGTYHMPCLYGSAEKVRVMNIHAFLLMSRMRAFARNDPAILMGDFNVKPGTSPYKLLRSGGALSSASQAVGGPAEVEGLATKFPRALPWPQGLMSAYQQFHGQEPLFTNYAWPHSHSEPFVETLDYIFFTPGQLSVVDVPALASCRESANGPFPNAKEPSDHVLLGATLRLRAAE